MNINITSDGTGMGTLITDRDGNQIRNVTRLEWDVTADSSDLRLSFAPGKINIAYEGYALVKMRKWLKVVYVDPFFVGTFFANGYKLCGKGQAMGVVR